jgi:signal transduction histidine kinase/ActR/RegA family two-component response regulator
MNMLRHPVWIFDIDSMSMYWANLSALVVWNAATLDELLQRDFISDMSDTTKAWVKDFKANQLIKNGYKTEKWTFYPKGIGALTLDVTFSAVRVDNGRIAILLESETIEQQDTIDKITARSVEILKHLPIAVSQFSMDGNLMYQNPHASKSFGSSLLDDEDTPEKDENISINVTNGNNGNVLLRRFVDVELGKTALLKIQSDDIFNAETQQYTLSDNEDQQQQPMDSSRWFNVGLRRARDPVTSDFVILYTARDISDIVKARNDSAQAANKSDFLDVMGHEIRTPLHQIVGFVDLLVDSTLDDEQAYSVEQIKSSCLLLISIINDMLDCSKLEYGHLQIENLSFDLDRLVKGCIASIGPQTQSKGITVSYNIDPKCPSHVVTDPNRLRQILQNLLSNAVKFTNIGSISVTIQSKSKQSTINVQNDLVDTVKQWLRFEVTDTGVGIDPNEQKIIFERYKQANASVARNFGGTGLGLPICKGLVELLGGTIELQSEVGTGTTVIFEIPISVLSDFHDSNVNISHDKDDVTPMSLQNELVSLNILIVEDNIVNQKLMSTMLQRMGHTVTLAENGEKALDEIMRQQFHIIFMDIQMPVMDGIECTRKIRNDLQFSKEQLPIIGLTAGFKNSDRDFYENEVGMNDCLGKPLPMEKLKQAISFYQSDIACI